MLLDENIDTHNNGKEALVIFPYGHGNSEMPELVDGVQFSKGCPVPGLHDSFDLERFNNDFSYIDDSYMDMYHEFLQAHFDAANVPPAVEAFIPSFSDPAQNKKNPATVISSNQSSFSNQFEAPETDSSHPWGLQLVQNGENSTFMNISSLQTHMDTLSSTLQTHMDALSSTLQAHMDALSHSYKFDLSSSWPFPESSQNMKSAASTSSIDLNLQAENGATYHPTEFKFSSIPEFSHIEKKPAVSGSTTNYTSDNHPWTMKLSSGMDPSSKNFYFHNCHEKPVGIGSQTDSGFPAMDTMNLPSGVDASMSGWQGSPVFINNPSFASDGFYISSDGVHLFSEKESYTPWVQEHADSQKSATAAGSSTDIFGSTSTIKKPGNENDILTKFQLFKQFDVVQDHSDHHFSSTGYSVMQRSWAKKIQEEWKILEKDLPDKIFVRVYESRMDLLRAVIVGAEGTPYHDGLFFFDVLFPSGYPNVPPHVHYHSGGLRINPNLYNCGKVCLSLLNTWSGHQSEKWIPGVSTMLQVLVSIQALILNEKPYFNEPGYEIMGGSVNGEENSQRYNENTFILSLRTMVYTMRRPPKDFEDFVIGHFYKRAQDILVACSAYMDGAQVGCLVKGGVQDVDAGDRSCSQYFKVALAGYITVLVQAFSQIGAKDCEKFLSLVEKGSSLVSSPVPPMALNLFNAMNMQF
ncbi:probable ubiquitin-conjugating enzyme E2 24 isoform X3 [Camellia sinensis]|nr:probable ubiquitin-conjugating enzyme E2 24 isoform X3 [Camellia sinensis]